jgi:hypothetical protein
MRRTVLPALALLLAPGVAFAGGTVAITPLVPKGMDAKAARNITGLISSELDFSGSFDTVTEVEDAPTMNAVCLTQPNCLSLIAQGVGAQTLVAGSIEPSGDGLKISLVYVDAKRVAYIKRQTFEAPADPSTLAMSAGGWVKELTSGKGGEPAASAPSPVASAPAARGKPAAAPVAPPPALAEDEFNPKDLVDEEDEFAFDEAPKPKPAPKVDPLKAKAEAAAKAKAEAAAKAKADAEARARAAEEARARAAEEARLKAEAAARAKAEAEERARAEAVARAEAAARAKAEAEEAARAKAEAAAQARAEAAAKAKASSAAVSRPKAAPAVEDEDDDIFGGSGTIAVEEEPAAPSGRSGSASSRGSSSAASRGTAAAARVPSYDDEEDDARPPARASASSASRTSSREAEEDDDVAPSRSRSASSSRTSSARDLDEEEDEAPRSRSSSSSRSTSRDLDEDEDAPRSRSSSSSRSTSRDLDEDEDAPRSRTSSSTRGSSRDLDEDEDTPRSRSTSSSRSRDDDRFSDMERRGNSRAEVEDSGEAPSVALTGRVGFAKFGSTLGFVTWGAEAGIPVSESLRFVAGAEGYSVDRNFTDEQRAYIAEQQGIDESQVPDWNTILPVNAGIVWHKASGTAQPYAGADLTLTPYTADFDIAVGFRGRFGLDVMVARNFGFNMNVSAGIVSGSRLAETQDGMQNTNLVPQFSAGTVVAF